MTPSEQAERKKLAETPGLTRAQKQAILDPGFAMVLVNAIVTAVRANAALVYSAKPEAERELDRKMGLAQVVNTSDVQFDGVTQKFGGRSIEIPR
jgi:hypothetical protein